MSQEQAIKEYLTTKAGEKLIEVAAITKIAEYLISDTFDAMVRARVSQILLNNTNSVKITEQEKEIFDYLNELRKSGVTNMFGAGPYLESEFNLSKLEVRQILFKWMKNFNEAGYDNLLQR